VQVMADRQGASTKPKRMEESASASVALASAHEGQEAHLTGFPFLLLDALLVDSHGSPVGGGGGEVIFVGGVVGALLGLIKILGCGVVGDGGEDRRREHVPERREHLGAIRSTRGCAAGTIMERWRATSGRPQICVTEFTSALQ